MCINYDGPMSQMRRVKGLFAFLSEKTPFQKGLGILEKKQKITNDVSVLGKRSLPWS